MLKEINEALRKVEEYVYFGAAPNVDSQLAPPTWDYIVYKRRSRKFSTNQKDPTEYYEIAIIRENFIPEDLPDQVMAALKDVTGLKLATSTPGTYSYIRKPSTDVVIEMFVMEYCAARKKPNEQ